ncbi:MAG TPA: plastocyanin/azurin family copper-binding protein [Chryseosolibacter sp.]|nr:plastocyanin/azurin family copper-binding protein [Chryseosolibacter sp.]
MKALKSFVPLLLSALLLTGCYSADEKKNEAEKAEQLATPDIAERASSAGEENREPEKNELINRANYHTVEIKQMKFSPAELQVSKGDTVVWVNNDIVAHDVTEESARKWTSSLIPANGSWQMVVSQSSDYYCSIHVVMKGKLVVK